MGAGNTGMRRRLTSVGALAAALVLLGLVPSSSPADVPFDKGTLTGASSVQPTSLQWGPDSRLYVADAGGLIKAYTVRRDGPADYAVTQTETIVAVNGIANHDDDGTPRPDINTRLITGLLVTGTASSPVIYVSSSDPGGGARSGDDFAKLDTNSSMISRLTRSGTVWQRFDVVRGLPRSKETHAANGLALDTATNTLYVAQGGNTNAGGPSPSFALLPEVAYSAAILSIDLDAIGNTTYDLPTLDDEDQP